MCYTRRKWGRGFQYFDENGLKIERSSELQRLRQLVIPPMWEEVRICKWEDGHIQATGRDGKGRKQYVYHSAWERQQQRWKFGKLKQFGEALPELRRRCLEQINNEEGWPRQKVLALMLLVLDETGIRIGNQQYASRNETYGLSTLRRKHLSMAQQKLTFEFTGKSNKPQQVAVEDPALIRQIKEAAELPGYELFRYRNGSRGWENVDSEDVNQYIQQRLGPEFSSKDFRTWVASRLAVEHYPEAIAQQKKKPRSKLLNLIMKAVAEELGNTPAVCKSHYVHPKVQQLAEERKLPQPKEDGAADEPFAHSPAEQVLLSVI